MFQRPPPQDLQLSPQSPREPNHNSCDKMSMTQHDNMIAFFLRTLQMKRTQICISSHSRRSTQQSTSNFIISREEQQFFQRYRRSSPVLSIVFVFFGCNNDGYQRRIQKRTKRIAACKFVAGLCIESLARACSRTGETSVSKCARYFTEHYMSSANYPRSTAYHAPVTREKNQTCHYSHCISEGGQNFINPLVAPSSYDKPRSGGGSVLDPIGEYS